MGSGCSTLPKEDVQVTVPVENQVAPALPPARIVTVIVPKMSFSMPTRSPSSRSPISRASRDLSTNPSQLSGMHSDVSVGSICSPKATDGAPLSAKHSSRNVPVLAVEQAAVVGEDGVEEEGVNAPSAGFSTRTAYSVTLRSPRKAATHGDFDASAAATAPSTHTSTGTSSPRANRCSQPSTPASPGRYSDITVTFIPLNRRQ